MNKRYKKHIQASMYMAIIVFIIRCAISFDEITQGTSLYSFFGYISDAVTITLILMFLYEKILWRHNPYESVPVLSKKYSGKIIPSSGNTQIDAELLIKQTLFSIHITLITDESKSNSIISTIEEINGEKTLTYSYINKPKEAYRQRSPIHYGTTMLCVDNPNEISGHYFTDRKSTGDMEFKVKED